MTSRSVTHEARFGPLACRHGADDAQASPGCTGCGGGPAFKQGFTWLRFKRTPVPPRLFVASSSGGSVVLFGSRYSVQRAPEGHRQMRRSSRPQLRTSLHACTQPSKRSERADDGGHQGPGTALVAAAWATRSRRAAHPPTIMTGCCQIGGCDRVGLDATRAFAGVERTGCVTARMHAKVR
jgi:hypothetical protein